MDKRLLWLAVGAFVVSTVGFVFSSLLPAIAADAHISIPAAGHLITAYSLSYAVCTPLLSAFLGSMDRRHILVGAMIVFVAGSIGAAFSNSFTTLIAAQIVLGAAAGLYASTAQAKAVAMVGPEHRARAISLVLGGTTFAVALGAPVGALISTFWGWRGTFDAVAAVGVLCAVILWFGLPHNSRGARLTLGERFAVIGRPGVFPALLTTGLYLTGAFAVISYFAPLAIEGAGMTRAALPAMLLTFGVGAVIGNLTSGQLADRFGARRIVIFSLISSITLCLAIAFVLKLAPQAFAGPALIGLMLPWGIVGWSFPPAQASRLIALAPEVSHLTMGLNVSAMYFGIALGTLIGGRVLELATPADLGFVGAIFPLIALFVVAATGQARVPATACPQSR